MNDSPLSPEAVAQMVADREAGTPGPWRFDGPVWNQIVWTDGDNRLCFMAHSNGLNDDRDIANASRITRLPDLEAAYLTLAAENATLRAERDEARTWLGAANNEFGSAAWNWPDLWRRIAQLKELSNSRWQSLNAAEAELATLRASEAAAVECSEALQAKLARTEIERDYDRRQTAHLQTVVDRLNAQLAAMTDSRDAAVAWVGVALEIAKTRHIPDQPAAFGGSELEWAQGQYASLRREIIAALTPTADKEPKT